MGAKVNHHLVPMSHRLANGDQIEVLTSRQQTIPTRLAQLRHHRESTRAHHRRLAQGGARASQTRRRDVARLSFGTQTPHRQRDEQQVVGFSSFQVAGRFLPRHRRREIGAFRGRCAPLQGKSTSKGWGWRRFVPFLKEKAPGQERNEATTFTPDFVRGLNRKAVLELTDEVLNHCECCPHCRPINGDEVVAYITTR